MFFSCSCSLPVQGEVSKILSDHNRGLGQIMKVPQTWVIKPSMPARRWTTTRETAYSKIQVCQVSVGRGRGVLRQSGHFTGLFHP